MQDCSALVRFRFCSSATPVGWVEFAGIPSRGDAMHAYSLDLRQRILADCDRGLTTRAVATKYSDSESWVRRLKQRRRQTGEVAPRQPQAGPKPSWEAYRDRLRQA